MNSKTSSSALLAAALFLAGAPAKAQALPSAAKAVAPSVVQGGTNTPQGNAEMERRQSRDDAEQALPAGTSTASQAEAPRASDPSSASHPATALTSSTSTAADVEAPPSASGTMGAPQGQASASSVSLASAGSDAPPTPGMEPDAATTEATDDEDPLAARSRKKRKRKASDGEAEGSPWDLANQIKVTGLIHSQFLVNEVPGSSDFDFRLANARFGVEWRRGKSFDAVGEVELSRDGDRNATAWAPMRDAYVRASLDPRIRLRAGQFKRPFGTLALTSLRDLKLVRRGISDAWISEELDFGERDVGFQADGKFGDDYELRYAFGTFNGTGRNHRDNDPDGSKDFVGRIEGRMHKSFSLAIASALKYFDTDTFPERPRSAWMSGASLLVERKGFYSLVEVSYGENYEARAGRHSLSALALVAYQFPIARRWHLALEPLVKIEELRTEVEVAGRYVRAATAGVNLHAAGVFRLMVQGEWIAPTGPAPASLPEAGAQKCLIVQAAMNTP